MTTEEKLEAIRKRTLLSTAKSIFKKQCEDNKITKFTTCGIDSSTPRGLIKLAAAIVPKQSTIAEAE